MLNMINSKSLSFSQSESTQNIYKYAFKYNTICYGGNINILSCLSNKWTWQKYFIPTTDSYQSLKINLYKCVFTSLRRTSHLFFCFTAKQSLTLSVSSPVEGHGSIFADILLIQPKFNPPS